MLYILLTTFHETFSSLYSTPGRVRALHLALIFDQFQNTFMKILLFSIFGSVTFAGNCNGSEFSLWNGNIEFTNRMKLCAATHMGFGGRVSKCLVDAYAGALGSDCATCFGKAIDCGREKCKFRCIRDSGCPDCLDCTKQHGCVALQNDCTGFEVGPPPPLPVTDCSRNDMNGVLEDRSAGILAGYIIVLAISVISS